MLVDQSKKIRSIAYFASVFSAVFVFLALQAPAGAFDPGQLELSKIDSIELKSISGQFFIDFVLEVFNKGSNDLKLNNCNLGLFFSPSDVGDIRIGEASIEEFSIGAGKREKLRLETEIRDPIDDFYIDIISSEKLMASIMDSRPMLAIRLKGSFDAGTNFKKGWVYSKNMTIDWLMADMETPRRDLIDTFHLVKKEARARMKKNDPGACDGDDDFFFDDGAPDGGSQDSDDVERKDSKPPATIAKAAPDKPAESADTAESEIPVLKMHNQVLRFPSGKDDGLERIHKSILDSWVAPIRRCPGSYIIHVEGHTDMDGNPKNQLSSEKRARAVRDYLVGELGMDKRYIVVKGYGDTRPVVEATNDAANRENRRVEIYLTERR